LSKPIDRPSPIWRVPMLEVMMMTVFLKSTLRPKLSRQLAVVQKLKQDIEHLGVRLFNLVQKPPPNTVCAARARSADAFLVPTYSRGRADQTRHGEFFHVLGHVDPDERIDVLK